MKNETFEKIREQLNKAIKSGKLKAEQRQKLMESLKSIGMARNPLPDQNDSDFADDILSRSW